MGVQGRNCSLASLDLEMKTTEHNAFTLSFFPFHVLKAFASHSDGIPQCDVKFYLSNCTAGPTCIKGG